MILKNIKVSEAVQSKTNTPGRDKGADFDELVKSVKEKGVLVPVLARPLKEGGYEVVAGNRRLAAAKELGLGEIPAMVDEDMDDVAAMEAQIIENLQRKDIHPLDEGEAYRKLLERAGDILTIKDVAVRVGKSEAYVRQRLFLTNVEPKVAAMFRAGKLRGEHAVILARLSQVDQGRVVKEVDRYHGDFSAADLKDWIQRNVYKPMQNQPWVGDEAMEGSVPAHKPACQPANTALFGEVKKGTCTDLACWRARMDGYISVLSQRDKLVKISDEYGNNDAKLPSKSNYVSLSTKKKEHCEFAQQAIVAQGSVLGNVVWICNDPKCKKHNRQATPYEQSPAEKAKRKAEKKREEAKEAKQEKEFQAALKKVKWPMTEKTLAAIMEVHLSHGTMVMRPICKSHGWEPVVIDHKTWKEKSYQDAVKREAAKMTNEEKLRLVVEVMLVNDMWIGNKIIKML